VTGSIAAEIIDLLAHERGLPPEKVRLSDRLLQDLRIDGDRAVSFFVSLQERFGTDLTPLRAHWTEHFRSEGSSCLAALVPFPLFIVGVLVAGSTGSRVWGAAVALSLALFAVLVWTMRRWRSGNTMLPITVGEVVAAVEVGAWPKQTRY
jgi:acyl carrier protein